jgi:hypothetical protein
LTGWTSNTACSGFGADATARVALTRFLDLELLLGSIRNLFQRKLESNLQIGSRCTNCGAPGSCRPAREHFIKDASSKSSRENVTECAEDIIDVRESAVVIAGAHPLVPESIVALTFVRIAEDFIRFGRFLELLFSFFVSGIPIGVVLKG